MENKSYELMFIVTCMVLGFVFSCIKIKLYKKKKINEIYMELRDNIFVWRFMLNAFLHMNFM